MICSTVVDGSGNPVPGYQTGYITLVPPGKPPFPITLAVSLSSLQNGVATQGHFVEFDDTTGIGANVTVNSSGIRAQGSMALQSTGVLNTGNKESLYRKLRLRNGWLFRSLRYDGYLLRRTHLRPHLSRRFYGLRRRWKPSPLVLKT